MEMKSQLLIPFSYNELANPAIPATADNLIGLEATDTKKLSWDEVSEALRGAGLLPKDERIRGIRPTGFGLDVLLVLKPY